MPDRKHELGRGQFATLACTLEVTIPKPGNVHRGADFADTSFQDFLLSAILIGPELQACHEAQVSLGQTILRSVQATRKWVSTNTNLGIVLLLAPLILAEDTESAGVASVIASSTADDCRDIFEAIRICQPGGLGNAARHDVRSTEPPDHVQKAMRLAASRDMIARQYMTGFADLFDFVVPRLESNVREYGRTDGVIQAHLETMNRFPDSLIARKNGEARALESAARAGKVLSSGNPGSQGWLRQLGELDFWLRSDGNRRNPGTTADLIAAGLFVGLSTGTIPVGDQGEEHV